jgi:N-acetylglucosaminyl-diphospho-decaprenol L-rhamnosyltransferase
MFTEKRVSNPTGVCNSESVPDIAVIIPSFNTAELLARCLATVRGEIIVVDNASRDGSPEMVAAKFPEAKLVRLPVNRGYGAACNAGAKVATADVLLFLNSDTEVQPGALERIVSVFREQPDLGAVACHELALDGRTVMGCRSHHTLRSAVSFLSGYRLFRAEGSRYSIADWTREEDRWVDNVSGFAWAIRRATFERLGGFDENLFLYCEEEDMAMRLAKLGLRIWYLADARIVHAGARSSRGLGLWGRRQRWLESFVYLRQKHGQSRCALLDRCVLYPFLVLWWLGSRLQKKD